MVRELENQYGLILGGSDGLGYASALKLARHGMNLIIFYRASRMQKEAIVTRFDAIREQGIQLLTFNVDVTREDKLAEYINEVKNSLGTNRLSLVLHSISKGNLKPMTGDNALNTADFQQTIHSMGLSLYSWSKSLIDAQLFENTAQILSFTSEGSMRPMSGYAAVSASKASLEAISRSMAIEWAPHGIRTNCIQAGVTDTTSLQMIPNYEQLKENAIRRNPFNELTTPQKVADVVYLLCKKEARWINGAIIKVDGGESLQ
jgi:enoyl-[acyl-carrier protein] reductase I